MNNLGLADGTAWENEFGKNNEEKLSLEIKAYKCKKCGRIYELENEANRCCKCKSCKHYMGKIGKKFNLVHCECGYTCDSYLSNGKEGTFSMNLKNIG